MVISEWLHAFWDYVVLTAPYLLIGFLASGFIFQFINMSFIKRHLTGKGLKPVLKASLFGVPLPLCSCSVIPAAVTLKKEGASTGATSSFLISTPESGVDSIVMTYGIMDLPMTILRPIAAFFTATLAGIGQNIWNFHKVEEEESKSCSHNHHDHDHGHHHHGHDHDHDCGHEEHEHDHDHTVADGSIKGAFRYAFHDLSDDLAWWLFIGLVVGAMMNLYLPTETFETLPIWSQKLAILAIGVPFYICASASTPIAASMMLKGMSPGTALIFLLVGPATNFTNIAVLQKYIGKRGIIINVIAISVVAFIFSFIVDGLYDHFNWSTTFKIDKLHEEHGGILGHAMGIFLCFLMAKGIYREKIKPLLKKD